MDDLSALSSFCLLLTVLFTVLWYVTSRDSVYETVDGDIVSTKMVFLIFSVVSFVSWLVIEFNDCF